MERATVELRGVSIGYKSRQGVHTVAESITASICCGKLTCLLGENGVGKSTLLRTLAGFQPKLGGTIIVEGRELETYSSRELACTVGVVLTERPDVQQMRVEELVALGRSPYTGFWGRLNDKDREAITEALHLVGIERLKDRLVQTLSDGERQKVMIAKALAQQTPVIFLDEPTAFLDYPSKADMLLLLRRISREAGKTVFLSTHDLELALQAADTLWLMSRQEGLNIGSPRQLADNGTLSRFIERGGIVFDTETLTIRLTNGNE
ncbi:MAG: ABC transporter ATP-binding protein [Prevotella sp.]|nr:ABC transporter ATP-binding protein [Prevotella sp.]